MKKQLRCCVDSDGQEEYGEDKRSPVPSIYPQTVSHQIIVSGLIEKTLGLEHYRTQLILSAKPLPSRKRASAVSWYLTGLSGAGMRFSSRVCAD